MQRIAKYRDFTWGKFKPFATLRQGRKTQRKFTMGLVLRCVNDALTCL